MIHVALDALVDVILQVHEEGGNRIVSSYSVLLLVTWSPLCYLHVYVYML